MDRKTSIHPTQVVVRAVAVARPRCRLLPLLWSPVLLIVLTVAMLRLGPKPADPEATTVETLIWQVNHAFTAVEQGILRMSRKLASTRWRPASVMWAGLIAFLVSASLVCRRVGPGA